MNMRSGVRDGLAHLAALGSADKIAGFLAKNGVCGYSSPVECPVALWLTEQTGRRVKAYPHATEFEVAWGQDVADNPGVVEEFVGRFDAGCYPDLVVLS